MNKFVCLLAVLVLAATASAAIDIVSNGVIQGPWYSDYDTTGNHGWADTDGSGNKIYAPDGTAAMNHSGLWAGWTELRISGPQLATNGNHFLEFDAYFASTGVSARFDAAQIAVDGAGMWDTKYQSPTDVWVDDVYYSGMDQFQNAQDTWVHYKIDLTTNISPTDAFGNPIPRNVDYIGTIGFCGYWDGSMNTMDVYISNMTLTPEPATIALLGLGGLALIRRKG